MVDPNRKINRLTDEDICFLNECEDEFSCRYTEDDEEFMEQCAKDVPDPPIVENWGGGGFAHHNNRGGRGGHNNRFKRRDKGWNYHHDRSGGDRNNRFNETDGYRNRSRPYNNRPPVNVRRDYGNFVKATPDD